MSIQHFQTLSPEIIHQLDDWKIGVQQFVDIYNRNYNSVKISLRKSEGLNHDE